MIEWWRHYEQRVPHFEDEADVMRVRELTGGIPLLIAPFLESNGQGFRGTENEIWQHQDLVAVEQNVRDFADMIRCDWSQEYEPSEFTVYAFSYPLY